MSKEIQKLKPEIIWKYFLEICEVPRPSKKEEKIIKYLKDFGKKHKLETIQDEIGNIIIKKPGVETMKNSKSVVLQSHIDMVCEKNSNVVHDFDKDPILPYIDGDWVKAKGTTLGADDGIGIATQLAILASNDIEHGPLECLFTVDEETGLTGAFGLSKKVLDSRILLNLDSEDEGEIFIGCAGGKDTTAKLFFSKIKSPLCHIFYKVFARGLKGGHSGGEIHKGLGNAVKIMNRFLWNANKKFDIKLAYFDAGNLRNAIAREAEAIVAIDLTKEKVFLDYIKSYKKIISFEYAITEPDFVFSAKKTENMDEVIDAKTQNKLFLALYACPHGVLAMSQSIDDFVETSTNLAAVKTLDNHFLITTSQRSSVDTAKDDACDMVANTFRLAAADVNHSDGYPGWTPNPKSEILKVAVASYEKLFNNKPKVLAIHAGLECGLIGEKYPGMDMISYGPSIRGAHSPDERLKIETVNMFWEHTLDILKNIAD